MPILFALPLAGQALHQPPDALEASVTALTRVPSATSPSFSPDGTAIAYLSNESGVRQVWIVPSAGGKPMRLTRTEDPVTAVQWSPDGKAIAYAVAPGGGMNTQIWLAAPDGSGARRLTDGGTETNGLGPFRADGKVLAIASNRRYRTHVDAWLCDIASGSLTLAAENKGYGAILDLSRDGTKALLLRTPQRGSSNLHLVDPTSKAETLLTPHDGPASFLGRLAPDGKSVFVSTNAEREMTAFGRIDISGPKPGPVEILAARDDADLEAFALDDAGKTAILLWNVRGRSELSLFDLSKRTLSAGPALPGEVASGLSLSRDGTKLALAVTGPALPGEIWVLELQTGRLRKVTEVARESLDAAAFVKPEPVAIPSFDGKSLPAWLYRAGGAAGPGPLVLSFHDGPDAEERPVFRADYQALLARGISVLAPNVRGSSGSGRSFLALDDQGKRVNVLRDVKACRDWVVERKLADAGRIGIMGRSYGGWVTVATLTLYPGDFAAGADYYGIVSFHDFFSETEPWISEISKAEYGDPAKDAELLKNLSPLFKLRFLKAPLLVVHGKNDTHVPASESAMLAQGLKAARIPVELIVLPDEGHGVERLENRIRANVALLRWFEKYLATPPSG